MNETVHLGRIGGVRVGANWSLLPTFVLFIWSLASYQLPSEASGYSSSAYWVVAVLSTVAFFASLLAHELSHAAVARRRGTAVRGIVLWLFGGVAQMESDLPDARSELAVAVAGPATSLGIAVVAAASAWVLSVLGAPSLAVAAVAWLAAVNAMLAVFNMIPAFPLDGGRVLRGLLWRRWGDEGRATAVAATAGRVVGYGLVGLGVLDVIGRGDLAGLWLAVVGWFVATAAGEQQRRTAEAAPLAGLVVADAMTPDPVVVPAAASIAEVVETYVRVYRHSSFPVGDAWGRIVGLVTLERIGRVPSSRWRTTPVTEASAGAAELVVGAPGDALAAAAARMAASPDGRCLVFADGRLVGIVAPSDIDGAGRRAATVAGLGGDRHPADLPPAR